MVEPLKRETLIADEQVTDIGNLPSVNVRDVELIDLIRDQNKMLEEILILLKITVEDA